MKAPFFLVVMAGVLLAAPLAMAAELGQPAGLASSLSYSPDEASWLPGPQSRQPTLSRGTSLRDGPVEWADGLAPVGANWIAERVRSLSEGATFGAADNQPPYVMLAGYYDTDVTYEAGGILKLIAYVMDPDGYSDIAQVELYYAGVPTGVLLHDDGAHGDFAAGDEVFGLSVPVAPGDLPPGSYTLEIMAVDQSGNQSDLWPYLTVHE